jgi:anti-sigma B factor antagonist
MNITVKDLANASLVSVSGNINGKNALQIQEEVTPLFKVHPKVILDLHQVELMASAGLRILLSVRRQVPNDEDFVLVGLNEHLRETMEMTGFIEFFTCYESLDELLVASK